MNTARAGTYTLYMRVAAQAGGIHTLQMVMDTGGYYNTVSNFNWFSLD